ncbi:DUF433 domain-containing protein [Actinokineospora sp.]|uniref:DUF433 domain-containing protein n=1 Tax=Actinokineospora sp. TaxID=1872133 RepID=UPI003D6B31A6
MIDRFLDPVMTPKDVARHLVIPESTVYYWLAEEAAGEPLVHKVEPEKRGWPSVPFAAVVEAYVLRTYRGLGFTKSKIREAAAQTRKDFDTPYALASRRIATDGIDIFIHYADDDIARVGDGQRPVRDIITGHLRFIDWDPSDNFASTLRLQQYPDVAPVIIDPRFGWGTPVVQSTKVPVDAVVDLWLAGEPLEAVAYEYDMTREQVEAICRTARAA